jgi:alpha,alpha-trehalase
MFQPDVKRCFRVSCLLLALGTQMAVIPSGEASSVARPVRVPSLREMTLPVDDILRYISSSWDSLTRSLDDCKAFEDVKTDGEPILYLPADFPIPPVLRNLKGRCPVDVEHLPMKITGARADNFGPNQNHGLLYLEHPYVVPGGQFNEMYGWDSYFIIRGLLRENRIALAKGMVENFFFEIENYGGVLNANRTYYLTRSQPPFLSSMVLSVDEAEKKGGQSDSRWLEKAYRFVVRDYEQWNQRPHLADDTGLSRYFDHGDGPVPEIMDDPVHYYRGVAHFFLIHEGSRSPHLVYLDGRNPSAATVGPVFPVFVCEADSNSQDAEHCGPADRMALTADFYKGDRSMRESGFDVSFRFGPFGAETHHYAPICLNSLLYKTEKDLEKMATLLGRQHDIEHWKKQAIERKERIVKYLWNDGRGLFFDYDFMKHSRSSYEYVTTFYPLWAGLASQEQAHAVVRNLTLFEQPGGMAMSHRETQAQWDYPYGWAPIQLLVVEGLRRYGYSAEADRIAYKFLTTVLRNYKRDGTIREKYDVVAKSSDTHIAAGYTQNVVGFGWTNGVFLELLRTLPLELTARLEREVNP